MLMIVRGSKLISLFEENMVRENYQMTSFQLIKLQHVFFSVSMMIKMIIKSFLLY
jgi:hypothetical protein